MSLSPGLPKKGAGPADRAIGELEQMSLREATARSAPVCLHMPSVIED